MDVLQETHKTIQTSKPVDESHELCSREREKEKRCKDLTWMLENAAQDNQLIG